LKSGFILKGYTKRKSLERKSSDSKKLIILSWNIMTIASVNGVLSIESLLQPKLLRGGLPKVSLLLFHNRDLTSDVR